MNTNDLTQCSRIGWNKVTKRLLANKFSVVCINVRSIVNKFSSLVTYLSQIKGKFTFIILVETWLKPELDYGFEIDGYHSESLYRPVRRGGGIKIYYLQELQVSVVAELTQQWDFCESIFIKSKLPSLGYLTLGAIYRPPQQSKNDFVNFLNNKISYLSDSRCILTGDFNLNLFNEDSCDFVRDYVDVMTSYGFTNDVKSATYVSNSMSSCLDHLWHNFSVDSCSYILEPNISDHFAICTILDRNFELNPVKFKFRDYSERNFLSFQERIDFEFGTFNSEAYHDANSHAEYLNQFLYKIMNKYFPKKTKILTSKRLRAPWMSGDIVRCVRKKHDWLKMLRLRQIAPQSYNDYSSALRIVLKLAEEEYHSRKLKSLKKNPKSHWKTINKLLNRGNHKLSQNCSEFEIDGNLVSDPHIISKKFNSHFINHPKNINQSILGSQGSYLESIPRNSTNMYFSLSTPSEVYEVIMNSSKNGSIGDVSNKFLKMCVPFVSPLTSDLFNSCIREGIFPDCLKCAKITPIFKKGQKNQIVNYRPISVLPNIGKILESLASVRLKTFFTRHDLLYDNQFGFRTGKNTEMAALKLIERALPALENKQYAICVFLDFAACFDTVDRNILLSKLDRYGVRDHSLNFIRSYFTGRKQYVSLNDVDSPEASQNLGVIQGSKLGPLFFDIYSNDLNILCSSDENIFFADDTCLIYVHSDLDFLVSHVNQRLSIILDWCRYNKLSLNPSKSEFVLLTHRTIGIEPEIFLGTEPIRRERSVKYLGLQIDERLTFRVHMKYVKKRLSQICGAAFRLRFHFDLSSAKNFYYSCVYSIVTYCLVAWGGAIECTAIGRKVEKLHAKIVNLLFKRFSPRDACVFKINNLLKLGDVYKFYASIQMFKVVQLQTSNVINVDSLSTPNHEYNTRNRLDFIPPFPRVCATQINFQYQLVSIWNNLPTQVKDLSRIGAFKRSLMTHLLSSY